MALFQTSVLTNYLKRQDNAVVAKAYKKYAAYFKDAAIQQNIRNSKEEQYQEGFLRELFVAVLGYTLNPHADYNLTTELKNEKGAKKADGAILKDGNALAVIELKSTKTKDLESIRQQAFDYKANQTGCIYVVTSNFEKLRFYINNAVDNEEFDLFSLTEEQFSLLYLCLAKDNLLNNIPLKIKEDSLQEEEKITKQFYADYSLFKRELFRDLVKLNMKNEVFRAELNKEDIDRANKNIKHTLFKKSQKLIDRFLFIFFAEDRDLLPPNSTLKILEKWQTLKDMDAPLPLYNLFKQYFNFLDIGRQGTDKKEEIFAYNGGLFKPDGTLDSLIISEELLLRHTKTLSHYDFASQVDVNILGHIFENSLNEIESVNAEIEGVEFDKQKTKRKKDGVFYTPKYITKYIVENTVGKLCEEKKTALGIIEDEYFKDRKNRPVWKLKELQGKAEAYRTWLLELTICDPACGSGAFLNQALDFLIKEHQYLDELQTSLLGGGFKFPDIENTVLENNIFGVDLNEESVEIAKLSLWLRTAQPRRKLNDLSSNIKCGNSLIDDKAVAGDKAFNWEKEFPQVFGKVEETEEDEKKEADSDEQSGTKDENEDNNTITASIVDDTTAIVVKRGITNVDDRITNIDDKITNVSEPVKKYESKKELKRGFDVVIGNPPYVNANELKKSSSIKEYNFLKSNYEIAKGTVDLYIYFFEKGLSLINNSGILSYITPNRFLSASYGKALRELLLRDYEIVSLIDYSDKKVFADASTYPVISFLKNKTNEKYNVITGRFDETSKVLIKRELSSDRLDILQDSILGFLLNDKLEITEKIINQSISIESVGEINATSTASEADDYSKLINENEGYKLINTGTIDPYTTTWGLDKLTDKGKTYLQPFLPKLNNAISKNRHSLYSSPKIVISKIGLKCEAFYDKEGVYASINTNCIHSFNKDFVPEYVLCWINSKLYNYLFECLFDGLRMAGGYLLFSAPNIKNTYIKRIQNDKQIPFVEFADMMNVKQNQLAELKNMFSAHLLSKFEIEKLSTKLQNWDGLEFKDFLKELKKAKVQLTLPEEAEWMQYFNTEKEKAQAIKKQITDADEEIDLMVYKLYELTYDEVKIVDPEFAITKESYTDL